MEEQLLMINYNAGLPGMVGYIDRHNHFDLDTLRLPHNYSSSCATYSSDLLKKNYVITTAIKCETVNVKHLYIFDIANKLQKNETYNTGGAYNNQIPYIWFYATTKLSVGHNYVLNLFACHREPGTFSIGISKASQPLYKTHVKDDTLANLSDDLMWYNFKSERPNENHYVKTFYFSRKEAEFMKNCMLAIPMMIQMGPKSILNKGVLQRIKLQNEFGNDLLKDMKTDFTIISSTGREFKVHKILVVAHSAVLREMTKNDKSDTVTLEFNDSEIDMLVQFLYTGTIKDILNQKYDILLTMAHKLQLKNLSLLVQHVVEKDINIDNVVSIAMISEEYNLDKIQEVSFKYIKAHPEVLDSEAWSQVQNTNLIKKLLKYIHTKE